MIGVKIIVALLLLFKDLIAKKKETFKELSIKYYIINYMKNCCPPKWLNIFKAISDIHRQNILFLVKEHKKINATEVTKRIKLSQPTVSHHLKILADAGLIKVTKQGKNAIYSVERETIANCCLGYLHRISK